MSSTFLLHVNIISIYEARNVVCFVLSCQAEISQTMVFHAAFLVSLESSWCVRGALTWCLRLFEATVWKLLIIEPFSQWKLIKIETENCIGILWWKSLGKSDLLQFISQIFRAKVWKIFFFEWILLLEIQKNC